MRVTPLTVPTAIPAALGPTWTQGTQPASRSRVRLLLIAAIVVAAAAGARLKRLKTQFEWGDIDEREYRAKMVETRAQLAVLPEADKIVAFDDAASLVASLDDAIGSASSEQLKALVRMLVVRVSVVDRTVAAVELVPAARPFFADHDLLRAPPDGLGNPSTTDPLAWYVAV